MGKGQESDHRLTQDSTREDRMIEIGMDFGDMKSQPEGAIAPLHSHLLQLWDAQTGVQKAIPCPSKAPTPYLVDGVSQFIRGLHYDVAKIRLMSDNEPSTTALGQSVEKGSEGKIALRPTYAYSSQSNGGAEESVDRARRPLNDSDGKEIS